MIKCIKPVGGGAVYVRQQHYFHTCVDGSLNCQLTVGVKSLIIKMAMGVYKGHRDWIISVMRSYKRNISGWSVSKERCRAIVLSS